MLRRFHPPLFVLLAALGLALLPPTVSAQQNSSGRGRKYKPPPPTARIEVTVLRDVNGKPIENAAVVFHAMSGSKDEGYMELKTNEDGKSIIDVMPIGDTVRLQIIAKGFQTFGDDYKIDKDQMAIEIRMKRPGEQYSIYKKHPEKSEGGKDPDAAKPANPPAGATAPANKPAAQPGAPPSQPQPK
ncbi:MAG: hypothetical protein ABSC48_16285 [Terracidiphilus sp.]